MIEENWTVESEQKVLEHPFIQVSMQKVRLPGGQVIEDWPIVYTRDYVNALIINTAGKAMVLEGYKHGPGRSSWQMLGGYLEEGEEPLAAVKRELLEETGYQSDEWQHLGSYVVDANRFVGIGHFFLALNARWIANPDHDDLEEFVIRWVPLGALKQALFDSRVAILSSAINISLGLLTLPEEQR
jgi:ADP-ribose pyrophosphatase